MNINLDTIVVGGLTAWLFIRRWYVRIEKIAGPLIEEAEQLAKDGVIDKADRKALVMNAIGLLEAQKSIKLNFVSRFLVSKVVDGVASRLPDYNLSDKAKELLTQVKQ